MIVKIKLPPESQEVLDKKEWFPIIDGGSDFIIGDGAYARVLDESEYILTEKTTADEFNKTFNRNSELIHNYLANGEENES